VRGRAPGQARIFQVAKRAGREGRRVHEAARVSVASRPDDPYSGALGWPVESVERRGRDH